MTIATDFSGDTTAGPLSFTDHTENFGNEGDQTFLWEAPDPVLEVLAAAIEGMAVEAITMKALGHTSRLTLVETIRVHGGHPLGFFVDIREVELHEQHAVGLAERTKFAITIRFSRVDLGHGLLSLVVRFKTPDNLCHPSQSCD
jgi:hypothetical protein